MTEAAPTNPEPVNPIYQIPSSKELYQFFDQFLVRWANVTGEYIPWAQETLLPMGLEEGILFSEPTSGLLVLRATENFRRYLLNEFERTQKEGHPAKGEIFMEMTVLFWHLFAKKYFQLDSRKMAPAVLRSSVPAQWPDRDPQSSAMIMVKGNPMELKLWIGLTPEDITRFRRPRA